MYKLIYEEFVPSIPPAGYTTSCGEWSGGEWTRRIYILGPLESDPDRINLEINKILNKGKRRIIDFQKM